MATTSIAVLVNDDCFHDINFKQQLSGFSYTIENVGNVPDMRKYESTIVYNLYYAT